MPVTQISIVNRALIRCGAARVSSITENVQGAILCNALYNELRDEVLRAHPWNFAVMRVQLAPTSTVPAWGYAYEYELPSDCLRVLPDVRDSDENDGVDHQVECDSDGNDKVIRTDEAILNIRYIRRHENESAWDSNFASAFAWKLAQEISYSLTQSVTLQQQCEKAYRAIIAEARSIDGMEGTPPALVADDWTRSRL